MDEEDVLEHDAARTKEDEDDVLCVCSSEIMIFSQSIPIDLKCSLILFKGTNLGRVRIAIPSPPTTNRPGTSPTLIFISSFFSICVLCFLFKKRYHFFIFYNTANLWESRRENQHVEFEDIPITQRRRGLAENWLVCSWKWRCDRMW